MQSVAPRRKRSISVAPRLLDRNGRATFGVSSASAHQSANTATVHRKHIPIFNLKVIQMAAPETTRIAHWLLEDITATVTTYANEQAATMIALIGPTAVVLLTIFVLLWGLSFASGQISEPFTDGMKRIIRMCVIIGLALNVGIYQEFVAEFFLSVPSELAAEMAYEGSSSDGSPVSIATVLDGSLQKGIDVGDKAWDKGDEMAQQGIKAAIAGVGYYAVAILVYLASAIIVAIAAAMMFVAFIAMAVLLAVGPLFILLSIFPQTAKYFEAWLGQMVNFAILYLIISVTIGITFSLFDKFLGDLPVNTFGELVINALKLIGAVVAIVTVLLQTRTIAAMLGGGAALSAQGVAGRLASMGTDFARTAVTGHSKRGIASGVNAATVGRAGANAARKAVGLARRQFQPRNTIAER